MVIFLYSETGDDHKTCFPIFGSFTHDPATFGITEKIESFLYEKQLTIKKLSVNITYWLCAHTVNKQKT